MQPRKPTPEERLEALKIRADHGKVAAAQSIGPSANTAPREKTSGIWLGGQKTWKWRSDVLWLEYTGRGEGKGHVVDLREIKTAADCLALLYRARSLPWCYPRVLTELMGALDALMGVTVMSASEWSKLSSPDKGMGLNRRLKERGVLR